VTDQVGHVDPASSFETSPATFLQHKAGNTVLAGGFTIMNQVLMHAWDTDTALAVFVDLSYTDQQSIIVELANALCSRFPAVIATGRDLQATTHQANGKLVATTLDRLIPQDDSLAKNVAVDSAASRKKSRSFFTRANSRLS